MVDSTSPVITLNYDTILETLLHEISSSRFNMEAMYSGMLRPTRLRAGNGAFGSRTLDSCKVFKLHGSINWYFSGNAHYFGEEILFSDFYTNKLENIDLSIDKVPLIVPPTFDKSIFLKNETIKHFWRLASKQITLSKKIVFIGYSFPKSDLLIRYFLKESCSNLEEIVVVDKSEKPVEEAKQIFTGQKITQFIAEDPIKSLVES
jgi:hypothetical protein